MNKALNRTKTKIPKKKTVEILLQIPKILSIFYGF